MSEFRLSDNWKKILNISYRMTFYWFLFIIFMVMAVESLGISEFRIFGKEPFEYILYLFTTVSLVCILIMMSYPLAYLCYLWREGERKKVFLGILVVGYLNIFSGYIWYYQGEIKQREIEIKFLTFHDLIKMVKQK